VSKKKDGNGFIDASQIRFSIIKQRGSPTEATTMSGHKVFKEKEILCPNPLNPDPDAMQKDIIMVKCIDYHDEHFVYLDPENKPGGWFAWCTCGSPAVIIYGVEAYAGGTEGMTLICFFHGQFGRHVTSISNKRFVS
jgi:hypothetical protein